MRHLNANILLTMVALAFIGTTVNVLCGENSQADDTEEHNQRFGDPNEYFANRAKELEEKMRSLIKDQMVTVKLLQLSKDYVSARNAKITIATIRNILVVAENIEDPLEKRVRIEIKIFDTPDKALKFLASTYAMSSASPRFIDNLLSDEYGDVCFASAKKIMLLRGNVTVRITCGEQGMVESAAKALDAAIKASADLPAAKDGSKFQYPKEMLTESATKPSAFFGEGADRDPTASYIRTWSIAYFKQLEKFIENYRKNWGKESAASRAAFCKLAGKARAKDAVPVLVEHLDFGHFGASPFVGRPRDILEDRLALEALIEISMPSLEPAVARILKMIDELPEKETDDSRHQAAFLHAALKELPTKILGKDLAIAYLKQKLEDKGLSERARGAIESALSKIEPPEEKADKPETSAPSEPGGKPEE